MVGKRLELSAEIRGYIKIRSQLGYSAKNIFNDIVNIHGDTSVSYMTVCRWARQFVNGRVSVENEPKSGRPVSNSTKHALQTIKELLATDARYTNRDLARITGISFGKVRLLLKFKLGLRKISARWIPHLLTKDQKNIRAKYAKKRLKEYSKFDQRKFSDIITGDEMWIHFYEPHRKTSNRVWATKGAKGPCIAKRTISVKKVLCGVFHNTLARHSSCCSKGQRNQRHIIS